jgi:hypothetical protein
MLAPRSAPGIYPAGYGVDLGAKEPGLSEDGVDGVHGKIVLGGIADEPLGVGECDMQVWMSWAAADGVYKVAPSSSLG